MAARIAQGSSSDGDPRRGAREAAERAREGLGGAPADLVLVFAAGAHLTAAQDALDTVYDVLPAAAVAGSAACAVVAGGRQLDGDTSIAVWAAQLGGGAAEVIHLPDTSAVRRATRAISGCSAVLLFPDSYSFPIRSTLPEIAAAVRGAPVLGGCASARRPDDRPALFAGDRVVASGAVAVALRGVEVLPVVAEGQVPIGPELVVSVADRHVVREIGGHPAMQVLQSVLDELTPDERSLLDGGINLGLVQQGGSATWSTQKILGTDEQTGAIAIASSVGAGQVMRVLANSSAAAERRLQSRLRMCRDALGGHEPAGALLFACTSRDEGFFGVPGHDAAIVESAFPTTPTAGFVSRGEIGPVDGAPRLLGLTTVAAVFPG